MSGAVAGGTSGVAARDPRFLDVVGPRASHYDGRELNSPNDVVVHSSGAIWFTDPTYGRMPVFGVERPVELDFRGVYRLDLETGALALVADDFGQPNGLCFSRDETQLYVNDTDGQQCAPSTCARTGRWPAARCGPRRPATVRPTA